MTPTTGTRAITVAKATEPRRQRASVRTAFVPILMVTARQDLATVQEAKTSGIDDYLIKPVTAGALATRLYSALVKRRQAGGPAGARAALRRA